MAGYRRAMRAYAAQKQLRRIKRIGQVHTGADDDGAILQIEMPPQINRCLLYTSDAADE